MNNQLITPEKVLELAFTDCDYTPQEMVTQTAIKAAQRRFIIPVIGEKIVMYLLAERYTELMEEYIEPALAQYTRLEMTPLDDPKRKDVLRHARLLTRRLSDHLEDNQEEYPEYDSNNNVLRKIRIYGNTIEYR